MLLPQKQSLEIDGNKESLETRSKLFGTTYHNLFQSS